MKASAASSIGQYERSVRALSDYYHTVELGLHVCLQKSATAPLLPLANSHNVEGVIGAVVFGSDPGLVGQFNDVVADFALKALTNMPTKPKVFGPSASVFMLA